MNHIHILLLRGIHTSDQIPILAQELKQSDVILVESVMLASRVKNLQDCLNAMGSDKEYAEYIGTLLDTSYKGDFALRLGWHLRGMGKRFYLIDKKFRTVEKLEQMVMLYTDNFPRKVIGNFAQRYKIVDSYVTQRARPIRARNQLTARQVARIAQALEAQAIRQKTKKCHIAVVQGHIHRILPELALLLPGVPIREKVFNPKTVEQLPGVSPMIPLVAKKIVDISKPLGHKEIDYFLYQSLYLDRAPDEPGYNAQTSMGEVGEFFDAGANHPQAHWIRKTLKQIKPIGHYTAADLASKVEALLATSPNESGQNTPMRP